MGECIAVLSGKGGTGKTSVTAAISTELARSGCRVLAIDCDVGLQNLDIPLGMTDCGGLSFVDVSQGGYELAGAAVHPTLPNLRFLTAPANGDADRVDLDAFGALIHKALEEFDFVMIDAPAGIDAGFRLAAQYAQRVILVTTADPAAVRDAAKTGQCLERMGKTDVRLIVNRVVRRLFRKLSVTIDDVMDQAGLPLLGVIMEDRQVTLASAAGIPLTQYSQRGAAKAIRAIAQRLQGRVAPLTIH